MTVALLKSLIFSLGILLLSAGSSLAQGSGRGPVHTEPPADDSAYLLMGEFVGPLTVGENEYETIGLQIRPIGNDDFDAIAYSGGLPGQQHHQPAVRRMVGKLSDGFLVLSGAPWAVLAQQDHCLLLSRTGERVGRLERIERRSPTLGAKPPADALVLFDGTNTDQFKNGRMTEDGLLMEGADIKPMFQDFDLHLEFRLPYMPEARDQARANSGVYIQSRYECQILDSFAQEPVFNGAGSLYRYKSPALSMSLPPLTWQTYDIRFTAPRWDADGQKIRNARVTTWLNGVVVQDNVELEDKTGAGQPEEPVLLPTKLQNHSDPVRFRNIWVVDRGLAPSSPFPVNGGDAPEPTPTPAAEVAVTAEAGEAAAAESSEGAAEPTESNREPTPASETDSPAEPTEAEPAPPAAAGDAAPAEAASQD